MASMRGSISTARLATPASRHMRPLHPQRVRLRPTPADLPKEACFGCLGPGTGLRCVAQSADARGAEGDGGGRKRSGVP